MQPVITLFGLSMQSYYLCAMLAGAAGILTGAAYLKKEFPDLRRFLIPAGLAVLAVVCARLLNYATNPDAFGSRFSLWSLRYAKLSLMGGLVSGVCAVYALGLLTKKDPLRLLDCMTVPGAVGILLLKLGCFLNGCCFGKPTDGPFGVVFPANEAKYRFLESLPLVKALSPRVHPTQLYEMLGAAVSLALALLLERKLRLKGGVRFLVFAAGFSLARLIVLPLRTLPYPDAVIRVFYPALYGAILVLCVGALLLRVRKARRGG